MPGSENLPSFIGEPLLVSLNGSLEQIMSDIWMKMDPKWKVAIGGKEWDDEGFRYAIPINRYYECI